MSHQLIFFRNFRQQQIVAVVFRKVFQTEHLYFLFADETVAEGPRKKTRLCRRCSKRGWANHNGGDVSSEAKMLELTRCNRGRHRTAESYLQRTLFQKTASAVTLKLWNVAIVVVVASLFLTIFSDWNQLCAYICNGYGILKRKYFQRT